MSTDPDLLTTEETAAMLRRPTETLRFWRWKGLGPTSYKVGRSVVYERSDVLDWLAQQKAKAGTA